MTDLRSKVIVFEELLRAILRDRLVSDISVFCARKEWELNPFTGASFRLKGGEEEMVIVVGSVFIILQSPPSFSTTKKEFQKLNASCI